MYLLFGKDGVHPLQLLRIQATVHIGIVMGMGIFLFQTRLFGRKALLKGLLQFPALLARVPEVGVSTVDRVAQNDDDLAMGIVVFETVQRMLKVHHPHIFGEHLLLRVCLMEVHRIDGFVALGKLLIPHEIGKLQLLMPYDLRVVVEVARQRRSARFLGTDDHNIDLLHVY